MIWGFRREADKNCALPGYYAAIRGNSLPTFPDNLSVCPIFKGGFLTLENETDRLSRSVVKELPLLAA